MRFKIGFLMLLFFPMLYILLAIPEDRLGYLMNSPRLSLFLVILTTAGGIGTIYEQFYKNGEKMEKSKALLVARLKDRGTEDTVIEIHNIGNAPARDIRISFAGRKQRGVCECKSPYLSRETKIQAGEGIDFPITCMGWKEVDVDMRWTDDSGEDINRTLIPLVTI